MNLKKKVILSLATISALTTLSAEETKLNDVVVTSVSGFEQNLAEAPASISVITSEELSKKSYTDVTDALKNVPGVFITGGGSKQDITIRGMGSSYTLFLIDGKPMQNNDAFSPNGSGGGLQVNFLPSIESIERIEIIRGPASSRYGSDAMGGVINIITKKNIDKTTAKVSVEYIKAAKSNEVNNDSINTSVYLASPIIDNLLSLSVHGSFLNTEESDYISGSSSSDPEFKRKNIGAELKLTPTDHDNFKLGYAHTRQERLATAGKSLEEGSDNSYTESLKYNYSLSHDAKYENMMVNSYINYEKAKNPSRVNQTTGNGIEFDTLTVNTQGTYFFDSHATSAGLNYKTEKLEDGATSSLDNSIVKMQRYQYSLFLEDEWNITDDLSITMSGRYDENEDFGSNFSPKAYAVYNLTNNFILKGGVTSGYKAPSLRQAATDFAGISRGGVMIGNPDLTPEKSLNYEAGVAYHNDDGRLKGSFTVYQTSFKDKITRTGKICDNNQPCTYKGTTYSPHQYGYTAYENVDEAKIQGIELTTDYQISDNLLYRHSYTYTDSEQKSGSNKGKPLNDISKHMFNAGLDWDVNTQVALWSQLNYRSETAGSVSRSGILEKQPSYTFVDLGMVYDIKENIKLKTGVYNIANKEVTNEEGYSYVLDGRRYSFAIEMKF